MKFEIDELTAKRIRMLASDLNITPAEVINRAIDVLNEARKVTRGHEASRNASSGEQP